MAMKKQNQTLKILLFGLLIALLVFLFHPSTGNFSMSYNGEQITGPMANLAAIPLIFGVLIFTGFLACLFFFGVGTFFLLIFMLIGFASLFVFVPFLLPIIIVAFLVVAISSMFN